jgi:hypothetical protein
MLGISNSYFKPDLNSSFLLHLLHVIRKMLLFQIQEFSRLTSSQLPLKRFIFSNEERQLKIKIWCFLGKLSS